MEPQYSFIVLVCTSILLVTVAWRFLNWAWFKPKKLEKFLRQQGLGGSRYKFLVGDVKEMTTSLKLAESKPIDPFTNDIPPRILPFFDKVIKESGKSSITWMGPTPALLLADPELIKEVLTKNYIYQKPHGHPLAKLLAEGVGTYDTHKWSKHRRIINPAFHLEKLKHMVPAFYLSCGEMLTKWEEIASPNGSFELDVWHDIRTLTGDIISRTAFGSSYEEGRKIFEHQKEQSELFNEAIQSLYAPALSFFPTKTKRRMKKIAEEVQTLVLNIIDKRLKEIQQSRTAGSDLLGILLDSNLKETEENGNNKSGLTSEEIVQECKLFYLAGYETTAMLLVWTLILLSKHPDWQARARDEVCQVLGTKKPDLEDLNRLKIVTMILYEVLRLYSPATMISRRTSEETKLGELRLPSDLMIMALPIMVHHDSEIWGDDVKEFNPERFSEGIAKATKGQHSYLPFSLGPRICIGQNFAMIEAKMALAMILQRFSFEISPMYVHAPRLVLSLLQPQYGAPLIFRKL